MLISKNCFSLICIFPSLLALLFAPCCLYSQSNQGLLLGTIHATGQIHFSEDQILAASGLHTGQTFDQAKIQSAVEKLGQTGAFDEVNFKYRPENGKMALDLTVKEAKKFHRCTLDNFVWAPAKEIDDAIRAENPLYDGSAPEAGTLVDEISESLTRLLQKYGVHGSVDHLQFAKTIGDPQWEHLFTVHGPTIKVQNVQFEDVHAIDESLLLKEAKPLAARDFSFVEFRRFAEFSFIPPYRERGHLNVSITDPLPRVVKSDAEKNQYLVQVTYRVTEGLAYDWDTADWTGNKAESIEELNSLLGMKHGDLANGKKLDSGLEAIQKAYGKKGFILVKIAPSPSFDNLGHKVRFQVAIEEGLQYRMGELSITGTSVAEGLKSKWRMKSGDVFDASYLSSFLENELRPLLPHSGGKPVKVHTGIQPDSSKQTVNVSIELQQ
jgi:outer membrane protein assembly factor BamA